MNKDMKESFSEWFGEQPLPTMPHSGGYTIEALQWGFQAAWEIQQKRVEELQTRLEIEEGYPIDGIQCRDATIRILDERIAKLLEDNRKMREGLAQIATTENMKWEQKEKLPYNWAIAKQILAQMGE